MTKDPKPNDIYAPDPMSWTGSRNIDLLNPDPADFLLGDIARSLSHTARYGGFTEDMVSVGHHVIIGDFIIRKSRYDNGADGYHTRDLRRTWWFHDAPEAYLGDDQRPFKRIPAMAWKRDLEDLYLDRMAEKWGVNISADVMEGPIKTIDNLTLSAEVHAAHRSVLSHWTSLPVITEEMQRYAGSVISHFSPRFVKEKLLDIAQEIGIHDH